MPKNPIHEPKGKNRNHSLVIGENRRSNSMGALKNVKTTWGELSEKHLRYPHVDSKCSLEEYLKLPGGDQLRKKKAAGFFVGGPSEDGRRRSASIRTRCLISLDLDNVNASDIDQLKTLSPVTKYEWMIHSTRKHSKNAPRYRFLLPLSRPIDSKDYRKISRAVASILFLGESRWRKAVDDCSYKVAQMMFYPTVCKDGEWDYYLNEGKILNPDSFIEENDIDISTLGKIKDTYDTQLPNPAEKSGIIGAFCSVYDIHRAISEFIPEVYTASSDPDRYSYEKGSGFAGVQIEDDGAHLYSNHDSDPVNNQVGAQDRENRHCYNSFDLIRIHCFGDLDLGADTEDPTKLPSFDEMKRLALSIPEVKEIYSDNNFPEDSNFDELLDSIELEEERGAPEKIPEKAKDNSKTESISNLPDISLFRPDLANAAPDCPTKLFGPEWEKLLNDTSYHTTAPVDYVMGAFITFVGSILGNRRWVRGKRAEWDQPAVLWTLLVGNSSKRKTPAINPFEKAWNRVEAELNIGYPEEKQRYLFEKKMYDKKLSIMNKIQEEAISKHFSEHGNWDTPMADTNISKKTLAEPKKPASRQMIFKDFTIESLAQMCAATQEAALVCSSEVNSFVKGMGGYNNAEQKNRATYLTTYDGANNTINRAKNGLESIKIKNFTMGILGGAQPDVVKSILRSDDDGTFERYLTIWPQKQPKRRYDPDAEISYENYYRAFSLLSKLEPETNENGGVEGPVFVTMTNKAAQERFREYYEVQRQKEEDWATEKEQQIMGKADGLVLRLALIFDYIWWAGDKIKKGDDDDALGFPTEISLSAIEAGIEFREHYLKPMNQRCMGNMNRSPVEDGASALCEYIVQNKVRTLTKTIVRKTNIVGRNSDFIDDVLHTLTEKNWLIVKKVKTTGRPSIEHKVNPKVFEIIDQ